MTRSLTHSTRGAWLVAGGLALIARFPFLAPRGPWRVTCGWPSSRATSANGRTLGECFSPRASKDETIELIVSIVLEDPEEVLGVLAHELLHAALPEGTGHRAPFARKAREIGLAGKPTATTPGPPFVEAIQPILAELGRYPHGSLDITRRRKQAPFIGPHRALEPATRLIKAASPFCGYTIRLTRKWLEVAVPRCPVHEVEMSV